MFVLTLILLVFIAFFYHFYSRKQVKGQPFIDYGWIPYFGVFPKLMLYKEKYLKELQKKHGDIFTLYFLGNYHHVIFDETLLKFFYTNSTSLGFYEYIFDMIGIFWPRKQKAYISVEFIKFIHKFSISKENQVYYLDVQKRLSMELMDKWKKEKKIDLLKDFSNFICKLNLEHFIGYSSDQLVEDVMDTDASHILETRPLTTLFKYYTGAKKQEDFKYDRISKAITEQIEKRRNDLTSKKIPFDDIIHFASHEEDHFSVDSVVSKIWGTLFGAQINTTMLLFWSVYRLFTSKDNELLDVKLELLNAPDNFGMDYVQEMAWTEKYIYEIFRIYYYGFPSGRKLLEDVKLTDFTLKKGTYLFNPLISKVAYEEIDNSNEINLNQKKIDSKYKFTPFGAGIHPCVGKIFAMNEVKTLLIQFYKNIQLKIFKDYEKCDITGFDWNRPKDGKVIFEVLNK